MNWNKLNVMGLTLAAGLAAAILPAAAQEWPDRDITFIVPSAPGGTTDILALAYTKELNEILGANFIMDYRSGGSGSIGTGAITVARPDGYTMGIATNGYLTMNPLTIADLPYKTTADYTVIGKIADQPSVLYVRSDSEWHTLEDFVAYAQANAGNVHVATSGLLTPSGLSIEMLNHVAELDIVNVPVNNGAAAMTQLLGAHVDAMIGFGPSAQGQVDAGAIRPIVIFSRTPYDYLSGVELAKDAGYDLAISAKFYAVAPNGMPQDAVDKLLAASQEASARPDFQTFLLNNGYNPSAPMTPEELVDEVNADAQFSSDALEALGQEPVQ